MGETGLAMQSEGETGLSRRDLLSLIGSVAGSAAMYHAMTSLGFASESTYSGPVRLEGDVRGASVLILGAGLAGMTAALELRAAGYKVQVLEFNSRPGGRNWTLRGGDSFTELGGTTQTCGFVRVSGDAVITYVSGQVPPVVSKDADPAKDST